MKVGRFMRHPYLFDCAQYKVLGDGCLRSAEHLLSNVKQKPFIKDGHYQFCSSYMPIFDNERLHGFVPNPEFNHPACH